MADSKPAALATAAAVPFPTIVERVRPHAKLIGLLALGHFAVDLTQGSLPAVLPFLKSAHARGHEGGPGRGPAPLRWRPPGCPRPPRGWRPPRRRRGPRRRRDAARTCPRAWPCSSSWS